jgi:OOP family OmpA-OmpF porin
MIKGQNMTKIPLLTMICATVTLGACDHYSTKLASLAPSQTDISHVAEISPAAGGEMNFSDYLTNEYLQLANYEQNIRQDYTAAQYYTRKIEKLENGQMVSPASFDDFKIKSSQIGELGMARTDLVDAMHTYNIPENRYVLAIAQSRYDCWMDQVEDRPEESRAYSCKVQFNQAMSSLIMPEYLDSEEMFYDEFFDVGV